MLLRTGIGGILVTKKKEMIKIQSHQWQVNFMLIDINKKALVENNFSVVLTL